MCESLNAGELRPGDVILYRGNSFLARAIRFFDGTIVNHAGIYLGGGFISEALRMGAVCLMYVI